MFAVKRNDEKAILQSNEKWKAVKKQVFGFPKEKLNHPVNHAALHTYFCIITDCYCDSRFQNLKITNHKSHYQNHKSYLYIDTFIFKYAHESIKLLYQVLDRKSVV